MTIAQAFIARGFGLAAAVVVLGSLLTAHGADPAVAKKAASSPNVSAAPINSKYTTRLAAELAGLMMPASATPCTATGPGRRSELLARPLAVGLCERECRRNG